MSFCEVGFIGQRNRLHLRLKAASMTDEAYCSGQRNRVCYAFKVLKSGAT